MSFIDQEILNLFYRTFIFVSTQIKWVNFDCSFEKKVNKIIINCLCFCGVEWVSYDKWVNLNSYSTANWWRQNNPHFFGFRSNIWSSKSFALNQTRAMEYKLRLEVWQNIVLFLKQPCQWIILELRSNVDLLILKKKKNSDTKSR